MRAVSSMETLPRAHIPRAHHLFSALSDACWQARIRDTPGADVIETSFDQGRGL